jgi:sec-independent protein translocase protein TatA
MGELSPWHLLILAGVFVLLFGAKRLPDGARSLGRSLRIFKTEVKGLHDDDEKAQADSAPAPALPPAVPVAPAAPAAPPAAPSAAPAEPPVTSAADAPAQQHEAR